MEEVKHALQKEISELREQIAQNTKLLETEANGDMQIMILDEIKALQRQIHILEESLSNLEVDYSGSAKVDGDAEINPNLASSVSISDLPFKYNKSKTTYLKGISLAVSATSCFRLRCMIS